jgi:hypothetical protein
MVNVNENLKNILKLNDRICNDYLYVLEKLAERLLIIVDKNIISDNECQYLYLINIL